jgi:hypothetical protein
MVETSELKKKIDEYLTRIPVVIEPLFLGIPYPQADNMNRLRQFVETAYDGYTTKEEQVEINNFTERQVDYYVNAAQYLGLISKVRQNFLPTTSGRLYNEIEGNKKNLFLIERMIAIPSIRGVFSTIDEDVLTIEIVIRSMRTAGVYLNPKATEPRRAETIFSWIQWSIEKMATFYQLDSHL